tara:strand:+ start:24484 stop:24993 length:510 start_codon:yes stop_codon:yes gene_type:complete
VQAKLIKDDNYIIQKKSYSYQAACQFLTKRHSPLIDYASATSLNCMGEVKDIAPFCAYQERMNDHYARAVVSEKSKEVFCISSRRVILKYACDGKEDRFCESSEKGCFFLKEKLAKKLSLKHHSLLDQTLSCYFDQKNGEDIVTEEIKSESKYKNYIHPRQLPKNFKNL